MNRFALIVVMLLICSAGTIAMPPAWYLGGQSASHVPADLLDTKHMSVVYLADRDLGPWMASLKGKETLVYGYGLGFSIDYLLSQALNIQAVTTDADMMVQAIKQYPGIKFAIIQQNQLPYTDGMFDLVFSNFVMFNMSTQDSLTSYLQEVGRVLKDNGYFIGIVNNPAVFDPSYKSNYITTNFPQNANLNSGATAKIYYKEIDKTFVGYYWTQDDFAGACAQAGLQICGVQFPLGLPDESKIYAWEDELTTSPVMVFLAAKNC